MCVVPEVDLVVHDNPGVVDLSEQAHARRHLRVVYLLKDGLWKFVGAQFLERRPRRAVGQFILARDALCAALLALQQACTTVT